MGDIKKSEEIEQIAALKQFPLFSFFNSKIFDVLRKHGKWMTLPIKSVVVDYDQMMNGLYLIKNGSVKVKPKINQKTKFEQIFSLLKELTYSNLAPIKRNKKNQPR